MLPAESVGFLIPAIPSLGTPNRVFDLNIALTPFNVSGTYPNQYATSFNVIKSTTYPADFNCCPGSDTGPFNDTDTQDANGDLISGCCSIPGVRIKKFLNIAIANNPGSPCGPCADSFLGALVYVPGMGAWTGNFFICGAWVVVYVYCIPPTNFGIAFYWGGVLATASSVTGNLCNPTDLQWDLSFPVVAPPGGAVGCHLIVEVSEP